MNQDQKRRDEIIGFDNPKYVGGLERFEDLSLDQLETLVKEDFVDLKDAQNSSPTIGDFLDLMRKYPELTAHGYTIGNGRSDYRLSIEGLSFVGRPSEDLIRDFTLLCRNADDFRLEKDELYSWWD